MTNFLEIQITEENILALRSFLLEGPEAWVPLKDKIQANNKTAAGHMSLLYGAFCVAVRRKFTPAYTVNEIVQLVAEVRVKAQEDAGLINVPVAEDMVRAAVGAPTLHIGGADDLRAVLYAEVFILLYLVAEMDLDRAGLEQFIDEVTAYTEQWLAARRAEASASASS